MIRIGLLNLFLLALLAGPAMAQQATPPTTPLDVAAVDAVVARTLKAFNVPGMAVAVVKDGMVVMSKGYGVSSLATKAPVDENTLFGIASNTKAFTAAALGLLVEDGKLRWDDKVTDHIPEFRMYDPYVTAEFTVRDLLTHRSGLGLGAGDLMFFPDSTDYTIKDVIHNLRYFKPVSSFRSKFDYDNNLYIIAGEVVARVAGQPWSTFVETRLLKPLGMSRTGALYSRLPDPANVIDGHGPVDGTVRVIRRDLGDMVGPAGGMYSSVADLSKWAMMLLGGPGAPASLFKPSTQYEMWSAQTILPVSPMPEKYLPYSYNTHFSAYGLGWFLRDVRGYKEVSHTGGQIGMVTKVTLLPELHLGIIVLTNQESGAAFTAVTNTIQDHYLGMPGLDRVKLMADITAASQSDDNKLTDAVWKQVAAATKKAPKKPDYKPYVGRYKDAWLGDVELYTQGNQLWLKALRAPRLVGQVLPYRGSTFVVRWKARSLNADAFAAFALDEMGEATSIKMKPISPATDFSYDFQDLDLQRVK
ncbi:serine hydrolase [Hymenobacter arizonensis]|uniref:CubicO group peptidase, beta-lactamase class C family n=1 Tax=Hymenobacter arizonensis TaxID=1227077 RepID=A0A1I6AS69_HYMAR|nr:serine hydrolase [Hymenobacter arizonensis]SFQ71550.1 CubicO group peptidase, beta-lactamase class C family [Hymenobacter arizonensis]